MMPNTEIDFYSPDLSGDGYGSQCFRYLIGERYDAQIWNKMEALDPKNIRHAISKVEKFAPEAVDVIAALLWRSVALENRERRHQAEAISLKNALDDIAARAGSACLQAGARLPR